MTVGVSRISCLLFLAMMGCQNTSASKALIVNGQGTSDYPAVVGLLINGDQICTGTFVSDTVVVTAGHCFANITEKNSAILLDSLGDNKKVIQSVDFLVHGKHKNDGVPSYDLAVVKFPAGTAPAKVRIASKAPKIGDKFEIVGYGRDDNHVNGYKRKGTNKIMGLDSGNIIFKALKDAAQNASDRSSSAPGDSGGPLLINGELAGTCVGQGAPDPKDQKEPNNEIAANELMNLYIDISSSSTKEFLSEAQKKGYDIPTSTSSDKTKIATENAF